MAGCTKNKSNGNDGFKRVATIFVSLEQVKRPLVMKMVREDTRAPKTKQKDYGFVRQYWIYLQDINAVDFEKLIHFQTYTVRQTQWQYS